MLPSWGAQGHGNLEVTDECSELSSAFMSFCGCLPSVIKHMWVAFALWVGGEE